MIHDLEPYQTAMCIGALFFLLIVGLAVKRRAWPNAGQCFTGLGALVGFYGAYDLVTFAWNTHEGMTEIRAIWLTTVAGMVTIESAKNLWQQVLKPGVIGRVE